MEWLAYLTAFLFVLLGVGCLALVVIQLPGGWLLLALALGIEFLLDPLYLSEERSVTFPAWTLWTSFLLLLLGEAIEFGASALGAKQGGATRRGMIGSLVGGLAGAFLLTPVIPIPIVGTLVGAILGTFLGAMVGETTGYEPSTFSGSIKPAVGATVGRVLGSVSKLGIALVLWIMLSVAAFWN